MFLDEEGTLFVNKLTWVHTFDERNPVEVTVYTDDRRQVIADHHSNM